MAMGNFMAPATTLRKPYMAAGGALVPQEDGIRLACKTIYVDQVNGLDTNNGRTWATAKQTVFGATGGMSVMADGDMMVIRGGHVENLGAAQTIALNYIKMLVEGTSAVKPVTAGAPGAGFTGFTVTISGTNNEFIGIDFTSSIVVSGNYNCMSSSSVTGVGTMTVSGGGNSFVKCRFVNGWTCSQQANLFLDCNAGGNVTFTAASTNNLVMGPVNTGANLTITLAAGSTGNILVSVNQGLGAGQFSVADLGTNYLFASLRSVSSLIENFYPQADAVAPLVTGGIGAGAWGAVTVIMAAGIAPATDYEFLGIVAILNMVDDYQIEVQDTNGVVLGEFTLNAAAAATRFSEKLENPVRVRAGVGIQARLRTVGGGSDTANIRIKYRV